MEIAERVGCLGLGMLRVGRWLGGVDSLPEVLILGSIEMWRLLGARNSGRGGGRWFEEGKPAVVMRCRCWRRQSQLLGTDAPKELTVHTPTQTELEHWVARMVDVTLEGLPWRGGHHRRGCG